VRNEDVLHGAKKECNILEWERLTGLVTTCVRTVLKDVIVGKIERGVEVMGRKGWRCKQLLDVLKERRGYWNLKEKALICIL
jgi:hypothetical protein